MSKDTEQLQRMLDVLRGGETAELEPHLFPREIKGPISIKKPITLDGCNVTLWAIKGPVLSIETPGVVLRNMMIEVTGNHAGDGSEAACAIRVYGAKSIKVENVEVRGAVIGLREEEGSWRYPASLSLGRLSWDKDYDLVVRIEVPVACKVSSNVDGLRVTPSTIGPGVVDLHLQIHANDIRRDTLLHGAIHLQTANLKRRINVSGLVQEEDPRHPPAALLWDPSGVPTSPSSVGDESEVEIEEVAPAPTATTETRIDTAPVPPVYPPSDPNASVPAKPSASSARPSPPSLPKAAPPPVVLTAQSSTPLAKPPKPTASASIPLDHGHSRVRPQAEGLGSAFGSSAGENIPGTPSSRRSSSSRSGSVPLGSAFAPPPPPLEQAAEAAAVSGAAPNKPASDPAPVNSEPEPAPTPAPPKLAKGPSKPTVVPTPPSSLPPAPTSVRIKGAPVSPLFADKPSQPKEKEKKPQDK